MRYSFYFLIIGTLMNAMWLNAYCFMGAKKLMRSFMLSTSCHAIDCAAEDCTARGCAAKAFARKMFACIVLLLCGAGAATAASNGDAFPPQHILKQLDRVTPQRPGLVDVYSLIVGGDGSENVFQREVKTVQARLAASMQTTGQIITLINNRNLAQPEATLNSIEFVIKRLAEKMDKEQDLLFLHLTSHGSPNHYLVLQHPSERLNWLGTKELAMILRRSGIHHRFIVISGCFSGGFIRELANENTVVVTASASTVSSYGCGDKSEITDFSRVFYTRALGKSRPLIEAAQLAVQYVHEEEKRQSRDHSYPQTHIGANMVEYMRQFETQRKLDAAQADATPRMPVPQTPR
jgi:Peptidase C13 family